MLERIEIRNFQSLRRVDLDLGRLTVIVGPSSSGKSGLMRALRAVASNMRGTGVITRGQKTCAITVRSADAVISLQRGDGFGTYSLLQNGQTTTFTKLAGAVPQQITDALRIAPVPTSGTSINFAGQFDKPYLLDESGATVARELGELTNVTVIFEAVRNANKARIALSTALKTREADLADLTVKSTQFSDLPAKLAAIDAAESALDTAERSADRVNRLIRSTAQLEIAQQILSRARVPELPDITDLLALHARRDALFRLLRDYAAQVHSIAGYRMQVSLREEEERRSSFALGDRLRMLGECPFCGQRVH